MRRIVSIISLFLPLTGLMAQNLTIIHLNDTHSHIEPIRGESFHEMGGVIEQAAYVDSVRAVDGNGNVLLLHAGDFSQGTSYFTEFKGDIEIDLLNAFKYDAVALGNHEFDNGFDELARRLKDLNVPALCANYDFSGTEVDGIIKPYCIVTKARKKIGIIGVLANLNGIISSKIHSKVKYQDPVAAVNKYADLLKNTKGCDLVICLSHLGFQGEPFTDQMLVKSIRNVDIIVGGHSHTFLDDKVVMKDSEGKDVVIVTSGKWGVNVGNLKVSYQPNLLTKMYQQHKDDFSTDLSWVPYPEYTDREAWEKLLGPNAQRLINAGEKYLDYKWENIPATAYLEYERTGDRNIMQHPLSRNRNALSALMFAELAEGKGRFIDQLINGTWFFSYMPSWVLSAHTPRQSSKRSLPDPNDQFVDLSSGSIGVQMAFAYHFFREAFDKNDPLIARRIKDSVEEKVLAPYLDPTKHRANWWLVYDITSNNVINNWNPWCNADVMLCFFLLEDDNDRLHTAIHQSVKAVDSFLAYIKSDGACEEGPAYWGHAAGKLYDYLQLMYYASKGKFSFFDNEQVKLMGEYISRSFVHDGWVVNFADASARLAYAPSVIYNYGRAVGSQEMMDFALYNMADEKSSKFNTPRPSVSSDAFRSLECIMTLMEMTEKTDALNQQLSEGKKMEDILKSLRKNVPSFTWYPQTQFCYMQNNCEWFFAAKGGHNNESHNHNDVGNFILYIDGVPMFIDAGVGTYTKKTFSKDRYTIWSMCSDWHNLPVINGITQKNGKHYYAENAEAKNGKSSKSFSVNIEKAYTNDAKCNLWKRDYTLKDKSLTIVDTYCLEERKGADVQNFMLQGKAFLPGEVVDGYTVAEGEVLVANQGVKVKMTYPKQLVPSLTEIALDDSRFTKVWGDKLYRLSLTSEKDAPTEGEYKFVITRLK